MSHSTITEIINSKLYTIRLIFCFFVLSFFIIFTLQIQHGIPIIARRRIVLTFPASSINNNTATTTTIDQTVDSHTTTTTTTKANITTTWSIPDDRKDNNDKSATPPTTEKPINPNSIISLPLPAAAPLSSDEAYYSSASQLSRPPPNTTISTTATSTSANGVIASGREDERKKLSCNIFEGRWVYKPTENPMYECPFLEDQNSCQKNGRPDSAYQNWSWEPNDCRIPLFNGKDMLERLRGKRVILVGDSLNRNQWFSLACLIYTSIPRSRSTFVKLSLTSKVLKVKDYDFTLEYYWSPFLVHIDYNHKTGGRRVLHLDKIDPLSKRWRGADIMVFNSAHWWSHYPKKWDVVKYKGKLIDTMRKEQAYEHGLSTWSTWLSQNINPNKTTVFFRSVSPQHKFSQWCYNVTKPIMDDDDSFINNYPNSMIKVMERIMMNTSGTNRFPVRYLNITWLSGYRRDAHPSIYSKKESERKIWLVRQKDMKIVAKEHADCSHWCLPGVPDTWNRLLYVSLFYSPVTS